MEGLFGTTCLQASQKETSRTHTCKDMKAVTATDAESVWATKAKARPSHAPVRVGAQRFGSGMRRGLLEVLDQGGHPFCARLFNLD